MQVNTNKKKSILIAAIVLTIIAIITNSQAMISDAFNSAGDILASFMTFIGNKIASKEADDDHNLGHGKAEYIFTMLISLTMLIVAIKLLFSAIESLFTEYNYKFSYGLLIVGLVTFIIKISLYFYTHKIAKEENNLLIDIYHQWKETNGYSKREIEKKREALENVLIPESIETHQARLEKIGFKNFSVWFRCFNFVSMVAFK